MQQGPRGVRGEDEGGRGKGEGRLGFWQVAARQRGGVCVEISLGKLCTTLDHGTLRVGIRVSCHISHQQLMLVPSPSFPFPLDPIGGATFSGEDPHDVQTYT